MITSSPFTSRFRRLLRVIPLCFLSLTPSGRAAYSSLQATSGDPGPSSASWPPSSCARLPRILFKVYLLDKLFPFSTSAVRSFDGFTIPVSCAGPSQSRDLLGSTVGLAVSILTPKPLSDGLRSATTPQSFRRTERPLAAILSSARLPLRHIGIRRTFHLGRLASESGSTDLMPTAVSRSSGLISRSDACVGPSARFGGTALRPLWCAATPVHKAEQLFPTAFPPASGPQLGGGFPPPFGHRPVRVKANLLSRL